MALKNLIKDVTPHSKVFIGILVLGVVAGLSKSAPAMFIQQLGEIWQTQPFNHTKAWQLPLLIALSLILSNITRYLVSTKMRIISEKLCLELRQRLLNKYLYSSLDLLSSDSSGSGGLMSRMLQDITIIQIGYSRLADIIKEPVVFTASLIYIIYVNPFLSLVLLAFMPFIFFVISRFVKSLKKHSVKNLESLGNLAQTLKESLDGSKIIRSFNLENKMQADFQNQINTYFNSKKKIIQREELSGPVSEIMITFAFATILILIGQLIAKNQMNMPDFIGYVVAVGFCTDAGKKMQEAYMRIQQALVARQRLEDLLVHVDLIQEPINPKPFPQEWSFIAFENVSYKIGDTEILKNISFKINRGKQVALVGQSGSGKTTLINLLERFIDPTSGVIKIGTIDIKDIKISELRNNIALVSQDVFLFNDTIKENIISGHQHQKASEKELLTASNLANAHQFIDSFPESYSTKVGDSGARLSGGEKQRISIARAILKNSSILLLDEATSALDNQSEAEVQKSLNKMMIGRTSIVIAHRLSTIQNADVIYVLDKGQIVQIGNHSELANSEGLYKNFLNIVIK